MQDVTKSDIAAARRDVEFATTEIQRWGMVVGTLTGARKDLRRGVDENPRSEALNRFGRVLRGGPETTGDRPRELRYLERETIDEGPADGKTFFGFLGTFDWIDPPSGVGRGTPPFLETFRAYVVDETEPPGDVVSSFDSQALSPAVSNYDADPSKLDDLVRIAEAGQHSAKALRETAIDRLNNEYDADGRIVAKGLVQAYHDSAVTDYRSESMESLFETPEGTDPHDLNEYEALVEGMGDLPIAMLPVGIETRFVEATDYRTGNDKELWVRVYPDDVHVDAHEGELTPQEEEWGHTFWTQVYVSRFPVEPPGSEDRPPAERFPLDPAEKLPDDPFYEDQLARLLYESEDGTTVDDFDPEASERIREVKERAWGLLCERAGRERAAYVAHATAPVDHSGPDQAPTAERVLTEPVDPAAASSNPGAVDPLEFPDVEYRPGSWTQQPRARGLPDRWIAVVEWTDDSGTERSATVVCHNAVQEPLYLGPDPESVAAANRDPEGSKARAGNGENGKTDRDGPSSTVEAVAAGMEWMVDFTEAEKAGMGFRVTNEDLGTDSLPEKFDRVAVFGVKASMGPDEAADELAEMVDVHHYTRGLELLPAGTPTNNHEGESEYRRKEDHVESMATELDAPLTSTGDLTDGNLLSELLGIGGRSGDHPFAHVEGADHTDWFDAYNVNSVLWSGTIGHFLEQFMVPTDVVGGLYTESELEGYEDLLAGTRDHFVRYVRGGGPLPALRIGQQPYGVLPATAVDEVGDAGSEGHDSVYRFLLDAVRVLRELWEKSLENVPRVSSWAARRETTNEETEWSDDKSALERVLEVDAVSNAFHRRRSYFEGLEIRSGYGTEPEEWKFGNFGIDYSPRLLQLSYADIGGDGPNTDVVATRGHSEPVPPVAARADGYLDQLSRLPTGDLVRLGYDYYPDRTGSFDEILSGSGAVQSWDHLSGLFEGVHESLNNWRPDNTPSQVTRLRGLFLPESKDHGVMLAEDMPGGIVERVAEPKLDDFEANLDKLVLAFVDALDEWLGELPEGERRSIEGPDGETFEINTTEQDGHETTFEDLEAVKEGIRTDLEQRARSMEETWGPGQDKLKDFFYEMSDAISANWFPDTYLHYGPGSDNRVAWETLDDSGELTGSGSFIRSPKTGKVWDIDPSNWEEYGSLHEIAKVAEDYNRQLFAATWGNFQTLIQNFTVEYLTLSFLFDGDPSILPAESLGSFRETSADAIVRNGAPLETKVDRDLSLFGTLAWFATVNENLSTIRRMGDVNPSDYAHGDQWHRNELSAYELFDQDSGTAARKRLGWDPATDPDHEIATEYGETWFGLLNAMRSEDYVGHDGTDERFGEFHASLRWMDHADLLSYDRVGHTERMVSSVLDLSSHRIDAWWSSLATRRLDGIRSGSGQRLMDANMGETWVESGGTYDFDPEEPELPAASGDTGTYLGAYGFVENLEYDGNGREDFDFVQAPSVSHARTAAILQSSYRSNPDENFKETMQVDLSPERVANAQTVLQGLREGLSLGEILGYFFERRVHEVSQTVEGASLEPYISDFRSAYPLKEGKMNRGEDGDDPARTTNVTDGYALYRDLIDEDVGPVLGKIGIEIGSTDGQALEEIFYEMDEVVDSVADLLTAENVHQLQQGNYSQAGRSIKALSEGKIPRRPEVAETTRDTVGVTHRLLMVSAIPTTSDVESLSPPTEWQASHTIEVPKIASDGTVEYDLNGDPKENPEEFVVRDEGAPVVNELAGRLFPDPNDVYCEATYEYEGAGRPLPQIRVTLADLELSPLDALYFTQRVGDGAGSKLESHVQYYALRHRPKQSIPNDAEVTVEFDPERDRSKNPNEVTFGEFVEISRSLRDLIAEGRPADATDFAHPGDDTGPNAVLKGLSGRVETARENLENVESVLINRLGVFGSDGASDALQESFDRNSESASADGGVADSEFVDLTADVQRIRDDLEEFAAAGRLDSTHEVLDDLDGDTLVEELRELERRLPAGETNREEADREVLIQGERGTVTGAIFGNEVDVDVYLPAETVPVEGECSGGSVRVTVESPGGAQPQLVTATCDGERFRTEIDLSERLGSDQLFASVEVSVDGVIDGFGEAAQIDGREDRLTVGVVPPELAGPLRNGTLDATVSVESQSPIARFSASVDGVPLAHDGTYSAEMDVGDAEPGTPFQVVVTATAGGERFVLDVAAGRYLGDGSETGVDDALVSSLTVLPRLLWLDERAIQYVPTGTEGDRANQSNLAESLQRTEPTVDEDVFDSTTVTDFATETSIEALLPDDGRMVQPREHDDSAGTGQSTGSGSASVESADEGTSWIPQNAAGKLAQSVAAADWEAIEREVSLMPTTRTTVDEDERSAVDSLVDVSFVDVRAMGESMFGLDDTLGVAVPANALGLTEAITTVGLDAPYDPSDQTFYAASDPAALVEAKGRIQSFLRNPATLRRLSRSSEPSFVDADLVAFVREEGVEDEFSLLLSLVSDPAWNVGTLSTLSDEPQVVIRGVNDLLYHSDALTSQDYEQVAEKLLDLATSAGFAANDPQKRQTLEKFETITDASEDFQPIARLARTLRGYRPANDESSDEAENGTGTDTESLSEFVDAFDDAVTTAATNVGPLATARAGHDVADAFREGVLESLRRVMVRAAYFGVYGAMPEAATGGSRTVSRNLVRQAEDVLSTVQTRLAAEADVDPDDPVEGPEERLSALFDDDFRVLPPFEPSNPREVGRTFGDAGLTDADEGGPLPVETWLGRSARVRDQVGMLRETLTYADVVNEADLLKMDVGQFPYRPGDDWVGIDGVRPRSSDRVSVVAYANDEFVPRVKADSEGSPPLLAGLFVDEWIEEFPAEAETTGVAFRYDDPDNRPPQSILLAVPPEDDADTPWTIPTVDRTIAETAQMAKYRGIDLPALNPGEENQVEQYVAGKLLPGLFFPGDPGVTPEYPEVDFTTLAEYRKQLEEIDLTNLSKGSLSVGDLDPTTVGTLGSTLELFTGGDSE